MTKINWDEPKYDVKLSLTDIIGIIDNDMTRDEQIELVGEIIARVDRVVLEAIKEFIGKY